MMPSFIQVLHLWLHECNQDMERYTSRILSRMCLSTCKGFLQSPKQRTASDIWRLQGVLLSFAVSIRWAAYHASIVLHCTQVAKSCIGSLTDGINESERLATSTFQLNRLMRCMWKPRATCFESSTLKVFSGRNAFRSVQSASTANWALYCNRIVSELQHAKTERRNTRSGSLCRGIVLLGINQTEGKYQSVSLNFRDSVGNDKTDPKFRPVLCTSFPQFLLQLPDSGGPWLQDSSCRDSFASQTSTTLKKQSWKMLKEPNSRLVTQFQKSNQASAVTLGAVSFGPGADVWHFLFSGLLLWHLLGIFMLEMPAPARTPTTQCGMPLHHAWPLKPMHPKRPH